MFKKIIALAAIAMLTAITPLYAASAPKTMVYVDPDNHSYVPIRALDGFGGIAVNYTAADKKINIKKDDTLLTMTIGSHGAYVNDKQVQMNGTPFIDNGTTYAPLQLVSQQLNLQLAWNSDTSSVQLTEGSSKATLPVLSGKLIPDSSKPVTAAKKTFKVGSRTFSTQVVTVSLLHPKVRLDVVAAHDSIGKVEDLRSMAKRNNALVAINGTFFDAYTKGAYKAPYGYIVKNGSMLINSPGDKRTVFTFDQNNWAQLIAGTAFKDRFDQGHIQGAIQAGPRLVTNGKVSINVNEEGFKDPKILTGGGARSALGITKDHKLILLTTGGATIPQLAEIMKQAGAYQAMNLDGGASSGLYYNGAYLTTPGRQLSNAIIVKVQ